jgi:hypothetical protein
VRAFAISSKFLLGYRTFTARLKLLSPHLRADNTTSDFHTYQHPPTRWHRRQTESDRVAYQLQLIAAYVRSLLGQPQLQQTQAQGVSNSHNELRDMKNRFHVVETQLQEPNVESVEKLKDRIDKLEAQNGQLQALVESVVNVLRSNQKELGTTQVELTVWNA